MSKNSKIILQLPFSEKWKYGYLQDKKSGRDMGRKQVILYNSHKDKSSVSHARYLMSVHLGRFLEDDEYVDHINNDYTDDRIENLQILSPTENVRKSAPSAVYLKLRCPHCLTVFLKKKKISHLTIKDKKADFCSRSCGTSFYKTKNPNYNKSERLSLNLIEELSIHINDIDNYKNLIN